MIFRYSEPSHTAGEFAARAAHLLEENQALIAKAKRVMRKSKAFVAGVRKRRR